MLLKPKRVLSLPQGRRTAKLAWLMCSSWTSSAQPLAWRTGEPRFRGLPLATVFVMDVALIATATCILFGRRQVLPVFLAFFESTMHTRWWATGSAASS